MVSAFVQQLLTEGHSLNAICQQLHLDRGTVRRFAHADSVEELLVKATNRTGKLDKYTQHLHTQIVYPNWQTVARFSLAGSAIMGR
jgi:hypothetical protein